MPKAQMHFEVDHELKAHWKAFFALLPRKSETRILTELMRNFLEKAKTEYIEEQKQTPTQKLAKLLFQFQPHQIVPAIFDYFAAALSTAPPEKVTQFRDEFFNGVIAQIEIRKSNKEAQDDPGANEMDRQGNREGVHDESGVEVSGGNARVNPEEFCLPEDYGE